MAATKPKTDPNVDRVLRVPVAKLHPDPDQPRKAFPKDEIASLAANLKAQGMLEPIKYRLDKGRMIIVDGERRWRAAKVAKLATVPVLLFSGSADPAARAIAQVAVNDQRAPLRPMERAAMTLRLRDQQKLSTAEIVAYFQKAGFKDVTAASVEASIALTKLPIWAKEMIDLGALEPELAAPIVEVTEPEVKRRLRDFLDQRIGFAGILRKGDVTDALKAAYGQVGIDLTKTQAWHGKDTVHFAWQEVCKGCEYLRRAGGGAYCMSTAGFQEHQTAAKEAGLGPGGVKPSPSTDSASSSKPLSPKEQRKAEEAKAEKREEQRERGETEYLHAWVRGKILTALPSNLGTVDGLLNFSACNRPGLASYEIDGGELRKLAKLAQAQQFIAIEEFLDSEIPDDLRLAITTEIVLQLPLRECLAIAHRILGDSLGSIWQVDRAYLELLRKPELAAIANAHAPAPEGKENWDGAKVDQLIAGILAVAAQVPPPPSLSTLYQTIGHATDTPAEVLRQSEDDEGGEE